METKERTYSLSGLICSILFLLLSMCYFGISPFCFMFPFGFGASIVILFLLSIATLALGIIAKKKGNQKHGLILIILGVLFVLLSFYLIFAGIFVRGMISGTL